jgi:hypothetical protein
LKSFGVVFPYSLVPVLTSGVPQSESARPVDQEIYQRDVPEADPYASSNAYGDSDE